MEKFTTLSGVAAPLPMVNVDTDMIIPKQFLKTIKRTGLKNGLFYEMRWTADGQKKDFVLDQPAYQNAKIIVAGPNFGCGSSREHAPQALMRWGIRGLVGESFAEIFFGNCLALGLPCLQAPRAVLQELQTLAAAAPSTPWELDVAARELRQGDRRWPLTLADGPHGMLLSGRWDATGQLLAHDAELQATAARLPYLTGFRA